jgi:RNA polymerase sigma factor (sigma-70 family)
MSTTKHDRDNRVVTTKLEGTDSMQSATAKQATKRISKTDTLPGYIYHTAFADKSAKQQFDPEPLTVDPIDYDDRYMPDDVTRDHTQRMHYAAHRMRTARSRNELTRWTNAYHTLRDRVVLGNRKLIYRAVRRRLAVQNLAEDMIGDCQIVLMQAVAAFNPWLGIRFSTYAYTCLVRALSRSAQRMNTDWLARSVSFEALPDGEPMQRAQFSTETHGAVEIPIDEYLRHEHPLLSEREKLILTHRYLLGEQPANQTLERVGEALGLSKERVRQVQASALSKLRAALAPAAV